MREIKFEVFDTHLKTMQKDAHLYHEFVRYLSDDRYIKRQYTGLKDKNGKDIYEGDVLPKEWTDYVLNPTSFHYGIVKFYAGVFYIEFKDGYKIILSNHINKSEHIEIIGNIYENPELLK